MGSEVLENYCNNTRVRSDRNYFKTFLLGILAGIFIAIGAYSSTMANLYFPQYGRILGACVFPIGIVLVTVGTSELFTGDCLFVMGYLKKSITLKKMLLFLLIVYIGNFIGSIIFALLNFNIVSEEFAKVAVSISLGKVSKSTLELIILGINCNILVCMGVWMALFGKSTVEKSLSVIFPVFIFVLCGFEHSIANMYYIPMGIFLKGRVSMDTSILNWSSFVFNNLLPVTLGNVLGGTFVGVLYYNIYKVGKNG